MVTRRLLTAVVVLVLGLALAPEAGAHALVTSTSPTRGAALEKEPERVVLRFSEAVETSFGAVRVFDAKGRRVDTGATGRPSASSVSARLRPGLADGPYTATYRVVSSDSHPVSGGFTFTVGESGGASAASVADLVDSGGPGMATTTAFQAVRAVGYAAIAIVVGGLLFLLVVWAPGFRAVADGDDSWRRAAEAMTGRVRRLVVVAAGAGALAAVLGVVLQGATASGTSFTGALDGQVLHDVLATRFGRAWTGRLAAFALVGLALTLPAAARRPVPRWLLALPLGYLVVAPALSGHAGATDQLLLVPSDVVHVAAMSAWVGGLVMLVFALPRATRALAPPDRTAVLAQCVTRFSTVALVAVAALVVTGVIQSVVQLDAFSDLWSSAFGRAVLVKTALLLVLLGLGAYNRQRTRPQLVERARAGETPGATGLRLRRAIRAEVALLAAVLVAAGALVGYSPTAGSAAAGPFSANENLGPARLELTVDPARVGANEIHLYLFDRRTGAQYDRAKELTVSASLPAKRIGPLSLAARKTGPGHYTVRGASLVPAGDWVLAVESRVSAFDAFDAKVEVPV
ncbi:MAG TPA: copper resistance protein CopC, partial [Thermoleophilaceae bacterium]|nr:copper resistance protein CopC [Thermoleophilaceae bacterium]